mmetsp:Transcript_43358/g.137912  ORF Transcript_43358/g.137912 Transcript_43358/m.137912 type:complete len:236 (-) Transcript_43358:105-812(-)
MPEGFALDEYVTPRGDHPIHVPGGTMPKSTGEHSGSFFQARKLGATVPGPGHYDLGAQDQKKWNARGGTFTKLSRDARMRPKPAPAVGQYQLAGAMVLTSPRICGGRMAASPKVSLLHERAVRAAKGLPEPGKYDARHADAHTYTLPFGSSKTASRSTAAKPPPGPGSYEPQFQLTEPAVPSYSARKQEPKSMIDDIQKEKSKVPAPGFLGIPDPKFMDRQGATKHTQHLLRDRC